MARSFEHHPKQWEENRILRGPRVIRDSRSGELVSIVERRTDGVAGARGPTCLIFSTDAGFTRVWIYPSDWQRLDADELIELTERWRHSRFA